MGRNGSLLRFALGVGVLAAVAAVTTAGAGGGPAAQEAYLKASNTGGGDLFGQAVAASGNTLVVGAWGEDSSATGVNGDGSDNANIWSGAAYVFVRAPTGWIQQAYLKASNAGKFDEFGRTVAISGDTVVIGASREDSRATGVNGNQLDDQAPDAGAAYVFVRSGSVWSQQAYLKASNTQAGDRFGTAVAISGDTIVVGATGEDSNATGVNGAQDNNSKLNSGAAYVFVRNGMTWSQEAYVKASSTVDGAQFGMSAAASGNTIVVASAQGSFYVLARTAGVWAHQALLQSPGAGGFDGFGTAVAISGNTIVLGARGDASASPGVGGDPTDQSMPGAGAARVFVRTGTTWSQQAYLKAASPAQDDWFGSSVGVSGDLVAVGAMRQDGGSGAVPDSGAVHLFRRQGTTWSPYAMLEPAVLGAQDGCGVAVAVSGDRVLAGGHGEDGAATGIDGDASSNGAPESGAAWLFDAGINPGVAAFGTGTPGCLGPHALGVNHAPMANSPGFQVTCDQAPPSAVGVCFVGDVPDLAGSDSLGIGVLLHVNLHASFDVLALAIESDAAGNAHTIGSGIPDRAAFVGRTFYAQALWRWDHCLLPPFNLSTSKGLAITILVP